MCKKLFISFLGTTKYNECDYYRNPTDHFKSRFVQSATLDMLDVTNWSEEDSICIFVTQKARDVNWGIDEDIPLSPDADIAPYEGLRQELVNKGIKAKIKAVLVDEGKTEEEIMNIFQKVFEVIHKDDRLYIDLTYGFRYLPMVLLVMSNYSKFLKNTEVASITYGIYDSRMGNRFPILDLMPLITIQKWTMAASDFLNNGRSDAMEGLSLPTLKENIKVAYLDGKSVDEQKSIQNFIKTLSEFTKERQSCRGDFIENGKTLKNIKESAHIFSNIKDSGIAPLTPILTHVTENIKEPDSKIERILDSVDWCCDMKLYQQAVTLLQEGVISYFLRRHGMEESLLDHKVRELVNHAFDNMQKRLSFAKWQIDNPDYKPFLQKLANDEQVSLLVRTFCKLKALRNTFDHAGFQEESSNAKGIKVKEWSKKFREVLCFDK